MLRTTTHYIKGSAEKSKVSLFHLPLQEQHIYPHFFSKVAWNLLSIPDIFLSQNVSWLLSQLTTWSTNGCRKWELFSLEAVPMSVAESLRKRKISPNMEKHGSHKKHVTTYLHPQVKEVFHNVNLPIGCSCMKWGVTFLIFTSHFCTMINQ